MKLLLDTCCIIWIELNNWQVENISLEIMEEAYSLPDTFHADPADRIIIATARLNDYTVLTADKKILAYPHVKSAWFYGTSVAFGHLVLVA